MKSIIPKNWTLNRLVLASWLIPGVLACITSTSVFVLMGWLDYQNQVQRVTEDLRSKSQFAARRISAELLLGDRGSLEPIKDMLIQDFSLQSAEIIAQAPCKSSELNCSKLDADNLISYQRIPHIDGVLFTKLTKPLSPLTSFLNLYLLLWSAVPVFLTLLAGLLLQRMLLTRYVLAPISELVTMAETKRNPPTHWPKDLKIIANKLSDSFEAREEAVFSMLAKGVIHDLKTWIHSLLIATEVVNEATSEKRALSLEFLHRACAVNLLKMKKTIESTLDGSQEIPIHIQQEDITSTISSAVTSLRVKANEQSVDLDVDIGTAPHFFPHDPIQLERAITNLLKNGIEAATHKNAQNSRVVKICLQTSDSGLNISIEDSGPGMPLDKTAENVFRPTRSTKIGGTGLGLYVSSKIVRGHRGKINIDRSETLNGARLCIKIPGSYSSRPLEV